MGAFCVQIGVGKRGSDEFRPVTTLVGSGAVYSMLPESLLTGLGIEPERKQRFVGGAEYDMGTARFAIDGRRWHCPVIFGPEEYCVLGKTALEIFGLQIDDAGEGLVPVEAALAVGFTITDAP